MKTCLPLLLATLLILSCKKNESNPVTFNPVILNKILVSTGKAEMVTSNFSHILPPANPNTLYTIDNNGANKAIINLPDTLIAEYASWSPDGSKIVFDSPNQYSYELYTINANGSNCKQLTFNPLPAEEMGPSFSPDGKNILYLGVSDLILVSSSGQMHLINTDGSNDKQLSNITDPSSNNAGVSSASFSPDGGKIAFTKTVIQNGISQQIFTMSADGTNIKPLTPDSYTKCNPSYSPDGKYMLYTDGLQIFRCNIDGTNIQQLTNYIQSGSTNQTSICDVSWSPDASKIVFIADAVLANISNTDVYTMNADGSGVTRLTFDGGNKNWARWR